MNKRTHNTKKPRKPQPKKPNGEDHGTSAVQIEVTDKHIEAAAKSMRQMKDFAGGPTEAQVAIAVMSVWLCWQGKVPGDEFVKGIFNNMNAIATNHDLMVAINNTIIKELNDVKIIMPGDV